MHPGVSLNLDAPLRHAAADPLDLSDIAFDSDLVACFPFDGEEIIETTLAFASWTGSAQSASCDSVDVMSGERVSASSGTFGCSLSVRVIIVFRRVERRASTWRRV